jgi:hypothetical protein
MWPDFAMDQTKEQRQNFVQKHVPHTESPNSPRLKEGERTQEQTTSRRSHLLTPCSLVVLPTRKWTMLSPSPMNKNTQRVSGYFRICLVFKSIQVRGSFDNFVTNLFLR